MLPLPLLYTYFKVMKPICLLTELYNYIMHPAPAATWMCMYLLLFFISPYQILFHRKGQNRAARIVTRNYVYETGRTTDILGQLKWESLKKRRKDNRIILLYKGLKDKARIPTDDLINHWH